MEILNTTYQILWDAVKIQSLEHQCIYLEIRKISNKKPNFTLRS